jgi:hypothetical protein
MLPSFPKSQRILQDAWAKRMSAAMTEVFPPSVHPPVHPIQEGRKSDFQREDRKIKQLQMKQHRVEASHYVGDGKGMTLEIFNAKAQEVGKALGEKMWGMVMGQIMKAVAETGNEIKYKKGNLRQEDFLSILEKMEINFDEQGKPTQIFILPPEMADEFKKREAEWAGDREFHAKVESIKRRKKEDFDAREARRRLVE